MKSRRVRPAALALAGTRVCPQSARLWYLASRAGEVMKDATGSDVFVGSGGLQKVLGEARARAPRSAAVVTVAARLEGSTALARLALELDPAYQPARCALAELLARDGAIPEALRIAVVSHPSAVRRIAVGDGTIAAYE